MGRPWASTSVLGSSIAPPTISGLMMVVSQDICTEMPRPRGELGSSLGNLVVTGLYHPPTEDIPNLSGWQYRVDEMKLQDDATLVITPGGGRRWSHPPREAMGQWGEDIPVYRNQRGKLL